MNAPQNDPLYLVAFMSKLNSFALRKAPSKNVFSCSYRFTWSHSNFPMCSHEHWWRRINNAWEIKNFLIRHCCWWGNILTISFWPFLFASFTSLSFFFIYEGIVKSNKAANRSARLEMGKFWKVPFHFSVSPSSVLIPKSLNEMISAPGKYCSLFNYISRGTFSSV